MTHGTTIDVHLVLSFVILPSSSLLAIVLNPSIYTKPAELLQSKTFPEADICSLLYCKIFWQHLVRSNLFSNRITFWFKLRCTWTSHETSANDMHTVKLEGFLTFTILLKKEIILVSFWIFSSFGNLLPYFWIGTTLFKIVVLVIFYKYI